MYSIKMDIPIRTIKMLKYIMYNPTRIVFEKISVFAELLDIEKFTFI